MKIPAAIRAKYEHLSHEQKPMALFFAGVLCLLFIILFAKGCQAIASPKKVSPEPLMVREENQIIIPPHSTLRTEITLQTVKKISKPHVAMFPGVVEADPTRTVNILPPLGGRLLSLNVKLGDVIKPQHMLAEISSPDLAAASADYAKAQAMLTLTEKSLERAQQVYKAGGNAIKEVQNTQSDYTQAQAQLNQTAAKLKALGSDHFSSLKIVSPIEGRVTAINYGLGSYINDVTVPLLTISNLKTVWVTANVPENLAGVIEKKQKVSVFLSAYPDQELHAEITFVSSFLDPDTRRNKTRIAFPNANGKLQPNMFASVHVAIQQPNVIMIPVSSILMNNDTTSVFVEKAPWTFVRRNVQLGLEDGGQVRVLSGLEEGERIATSGGVFMND